METIRNAVMDIGEPRQLVLPCPYCGDNKVHKNQSSKKLDHFSTENEQAQINAKDNFLLLANVCLPLYPLMKLVPPKLYPNPKIEKLLGIV
jgi:hypothetical protein